MNTAILLHVLFDENVLTDVIPRRNYMQLLRLPVRSAIELFLCSITMIFAVYLGHGVLYWVAL